jgi:hypothetical protein
MAMSDLMEKVFLSNGIAVQRTAKFMIVTPEMAKKWLGENRENRRKRGWWVQALVSAINRGEWITTHQGIAFTTSGRLADGQHRLEAIVESGVALEMLVVTGLGEDCFKVIDNGVKRTISDLTGMSKGVAETCRFFGAMIFGGNVSPQQCQDVADSGVEEIHDKLTECCPSKKAYYSSTPMRAAAICLVMDGIKKEDVFSGYRNLVMEKFSDLTIIQQGLVRQVNSQKTRAGMTSDVFTRGIKCLNPNNALLTKVVAAESDISGATSYAKTIIRRSISYSA